MSRIIAIAPEEFPGVSAVFRNGAALGLWEFVPFGKRIPLDAEFIILGGWIDSYAGLLSNPRCPAAVFITSTIAQMEFSYNQIELQAVRKIGSLLESNLIKYVLAGWPDVIDYAFSKNKKEGRAIHFPYPLQIKEYPRSEKLPDSIGLFAPFAPRKNLQNQILAATSCGTLHTNLNVPGPKVVSYGWLEQSTYFELLSKLKVTLHCGFTESFCYAAAESLMCGTLPVMSLQVAENLGIPEYALSVVKQPDSVYNIRMRIKTVLLYSDYDLTVKDYLENLKRIAFLNNNEAKIILDRIAS